MDYQSFVRIVAAHMTTQAHVRGIKHHEDYGTILVTLADKSQFALTVSAMDEGAAAQNGDAAKDEGAAKPAATRRTSKAAK